MKIKDIKKGEWYETTKGTGVCEAVGGTHPPSVQMRITLPYPRGRLYMAPRDILRKVDRPVHNQADDPAPHVEE